MPIVTKSDAIRHEMHGSTFTVYAGPSQGGKELCAWRLNVPAGSTGVEHRVSNEEVLHVLAGRPAVSLDGVPTPVEPGDVVMVPAGARLCIDTPADSSAAVWVTTTVGIRAELPDGSMITPPWAA